MFHGLEGSVGAEAVTTQQVCKCNLHPSNTMIVHRRPRVKMNR